MRNKGLHIVLISILFGLLVSVRYFEFWFYDPLKHYFEQDYLYKGLPDLQIGKLILNNSMRYSINSAISIAIIWIVFKNKHFLRFSISFYFLAFIVLILSFLFLLKTTIIQSYLPLFYTRRFLIQPLFVLLLLPAFYYQNRN